MKSHRAIKGDLYSYLADELPESQRRTLESHLQSCADCRDELEALRDLSGLLEHQGGRASTRRSELYWQNFPAKVMRRIENEVHSHQESSLVQRLLELLVENRRPFGIGFASALSLVVIGFAAWTLWLSPVEEVAQEQSLAAAERETGTPFVRTAALESRTREYLDQSKVLLIGIVNTDPAGLQELRPLLRRQREVSKSLAGESQWLVASLNDPSQRRLRDLVADLGVILTQIANLDAESDLQGVEIVKGGVERSGVLFKINLEQMIQASGKVARRTNEQNQMPIL